MLAQLLACKTDFSDADSGGGPCLKRTLGPWGLTALGIGAVIGSGIFVVTGQAAALHAGPAVVLSFVLAAIACGFTALCYAEFATLIPMSGSSYSYAYATLGELAAWFIGWNMVLEYGVSASAVAASWTGYFTSLLDHVGMHLPIALTNAPVAFADDHLATTGALFNLPAVGIVLALTWLCYVGIRESSGVNVAMVAIGVLILRKQQPDRPRPFRTPMVWFVCPLAVFGCLLLFWNLSTFAKEFFVCWAAFGLVLYRFYGYRRSHLANGTSSPN